LHKIRDQFLFRHELLGQSLRSELRLGNTSTKRYENAVKTQICIALSAYLLMALIKKKLNVTLDLYQILQITSVSLFNKKPMKSLFSEAELQFDVKGGQESPGLQWF